VPVVHCSTLLSLVQELETCTTSSEQLIELVTELVDSGRVVLVGSFAGARLTPSP